MPGDSAATSCPDWFALGNHVCSVTNPVAATDELDEDDNTEFEPFDWEALGVDEEPMSRGN